MNSINLVIIFLGLALTFDFVQSEWKTPEFWKDLVPSKLKSKIDEPLETSEEVGEHLELHFIDYFKSKKTHMTVDSYKGTGIVGSQAKVICAPIKTRGDDHFITLSILIELKEKFPTPIEMAIISAIFRQKMLDQTGWRINFDDKNWMNGIVFKFGTRLYQLMNDPENHFKSCNVIVTIHFKISKSKLILSPDFDNFEIVSDDPPAPYFEEPLD